tara:strand:- start:49 stop:162 length:114 start_codon:yes stop_codon:yes gene_type:complete
MLKQKGAGFLKSTQVIQITKEAYSEIYLDKPMFFRQI